ncbi:MAG: AAA family ATPase [Ktedonobacteraceae bacterium]|nr:AAA family ATPase [Ktedonobacteraceae bacterium]
MRCPNCQTINPLNAKFCLECGNRLVVCANCGNINVPFAKYCIECGTALHNTQAEQHNIRLLATVSPQPTEQVATPQQHSMVDAVAEELLPPEERRVVTVLFADITGSTPLADRLDPEDMRAMLTDYFNLMTEQIRKHDGTVEKYIGDAVMAVFGSPIAHEDDPDRAIRATLDMQAALVKFNQQRQAQDAEATRLQMRIGINTGEVASLKSTQQPRQDFLITGDAVNIAARLQQVAAPDTILVGERTYLATRGVFEFRAMAPLSIKGKVEPIIAYVVQGLHNRTPVIPQRPRGIDGRQATLVGRALELTLLHTSYDRVQNERHPHLITILGVPGIGKSRLIQEFINREHEQIKNTSSLNDLAAPLVLQGRCPPYGEAITYWPLIEILRSLLHIQEEEADDSDIEQRFKDFVYATLSRTKRTESTDEIATPILRSIGRDLGGDKGSAPGLLLRAWRILLESLAERQSLIIVVDDLQWADEALLDLLEYLTERITTVPLFFLCCARPDFFERRRDWGGGRRNFTTIALESLSQAESSELIDELLNTGDLPDVLRNTILARAEGNPFFVEEIVRMFIDQGVLICDNDDEYASPCWRFDSNKRSMLSELATSDDPTEDTMLSMHYLLPLPRVPDTIQGVLAARIDLLNPLDKLVLQYAAIIGRIFWLSALRQLAADLDADTILALLRSLVQHDFVSEAERVIRSPIEQDCVYSFKHILIRDVVYNNIPRMHRSQEHTRLALWLEEQIAKDREAFVELLAYHYQQALVTWSPRLLVSNGSNAGDAVGLTRAELRYRAINYLIMAGDQALYSYHTLRAIQAYGETFELLTDGQVDTPALVQIHEKLGDAYFQRNALDEAWQQYRRALHLAKEPNVLVNEEDLLRLYERLAELATRWQGGFDRPPNLDETRQYIDAGLQLLEHQPTSRERVNFLTYQAFWYIRYLEVATNAQKVELIEQALVSGQQALHLAEELNDASTISLALDALGFIYTESHRYEDAHRTQQRRQKLETRLTSREELHDLYISLGRAHEHIADYSNALMWFGRAWSNAQTIESPSMLLTSMAGRMRVWCQWDRWDDTIQVALDMLKFIEKYQQDEKHQFWVCETLATIAYHRGQQEQGDQYAHQCKRFLDQQLERTSTIPEATLTTSMHAIHLARGDWALVAMDYKEKLRLSEPLPSPEVLCTLAEALVTIGESTETQESTCQQAVELAQQSGARKSLIIALRTRGRMHMEQQHWPQAETDLRQALKYCEALDLPWERGLTLYHLGLFYRRRASILNEHNPHLRNTDMSRACYHLEQALGFFESLHAVPDSELARFALNDTV